MPPASRAPHARLAFAVAAVAIAAAASRAPAQYYTWSGATGSSWNDPTNWAGEAPFNGGDVALFAQELHFGPTTNATSVNDAVDGFAVYQMTFAADAPAYTLDGMAVAFQSGGALTQSSSSPVNVLNPLTLSDTLTVGGSGSGSGPVTLAGAISGPGGIALSGPVDVTLANANNTFTGPVTVNATNHLTITAPTGLAGAVVLNSDLANNTFAVLNVPNGITLAGSASIQGHGLINGTVTNNSPQGLQPGDIVTYTPASLTLGPQHLSVLGIQFAPINATLDGTTLDTLGLPFIYGTSVSGRGVIQAQFTRPAFNASPSNISLTGDLTVGVPTATSRLLNVTVNTGPHTFTAVGHVAVQDSTITLAGGRALFPDQNLDLFTNTTITGAGVFLAQPEFSYTLDALPTYTPTAPLPTLSDLHVDAPHFAHILSTTPTAVSNVTLAGGSIVAPAGLTASAADVISGYGAIDAPVTGVNFTPTAPYPVFDRRAQTSHVQLLSTAPTLLDMSNARFGAGGYDGFPTLPAGGTTLDAPAGLTLGSVGSGGPLTINTPELHFASAGFNGGTTFLFNDATTVHAAVAYFHDTHLANIPNFTIDGDAHFGSARLDAAHNLTVTGNADMDGAVLRDADTWTLPHGITGNGLLAGSGPITASLAVAPQGALQPLPVDTFRTGGHFLIVSDSPYTVTDTLQDIPFSDIAGTAPITMIGSIINSGGAFHGAVHNIAIIDPAVTTQAGVGQNLLTVGDPSLDNAVQTQQLWVITGVTLLSKTPSTVDQLLISAVGILNAPAGISAGDVEVLGGVTGYGTVGSAIIHGPLTASGSFRIHQGGPDDDYFFDSVDAAYGEFHPGTVHLAGRPGNLPALIPQTNDVDGTVFDASASPAGLLIRPGTSLIATSSPAFHGTLLLDGTIANNSATPVYVYNTLTGNGSVTGGPVALRGPAANLNPGRVGAIGTLTVADLSILPGDGPDPAGTMTFELSSAGHDTLTSTGHLALAGTLSVSLLDGYIPAYLTHFPIISAATGISGAFQTIAGRQIDPLHVLVPLYSPTGLDLVVALPGDANLDGALNPDDFALLDRGYAAHLTGWSNGDFNADGQIDQNDYLLIDTTLGQTQGVGPGFLALRESQFGPAYVQQLLTSVPEPSSLLAAAFCLLTSLRRRRPLRSPPCPL